MTFKVGKKQKGFTMIELVIVIAILGVLAAFALPRFASFTDQAYTSKAESIRGTLSASVGIVKAKHIASGATGTTVDMNGYIIPVTATGDINFTIAAATATSCTNLLNGLLTNATKLNFGKTVGAPMCNVFEKYSNGLADVRTYVYIGSNGIS